MPTFEERKAAFIELGQYIGSLIDESSLNSTHKDQKFDQVLRLAQAENQWFTESNICFALKEWSKALDASSIEQWLSGYKLEQMQHNKIIGVVMAGNIPMVGFHDFLSVLICGHDLMAKLSSNDKRLLPYLAEKLSKIEPGFKSKINFEENQLKINETNHLLKKEKNQNQNIDFKLKNIAVKITCLILVCTIFLLGIYLILSIQN